MQRITLADRLELEDAPDLALRCNQVDLEGPDNLVWRAAEMLRNRYGVRRGAAMTLRKRVPVAAGLGGGSSDAAAALRGLCRLWNLRLSDQTLLELGALLGSDVPFFLQERSCALAAGRGEVLTALPALPMRWLVLVTPPVGIAARAVYQAFPPARWSNGSRTAQWLEQAHRTATVPAPFNDLEAVALQVEPRAAAARDALRAAGAPRPIMSGSGSTYFALFERDAEARLVHDRVVAAGWKDVTLAQFAVTTTCGTVNDLTPHV